MKVLKIVGSILGWVVVGFLLVAMVFNIVDKSTGYKAPLFGLRPTAIVTESMASVNEANTYVDPSWDRINKDDVVLTKNCNYEDINQYDVITFITKDGILICHRVIDLYEVDGEKYLVTRGDANNTNDAPIKASEVRGKVISIWRGLGKLVSFVSSLYFVLAIFASMFFIALGYIIYILIRDKEKKGDQTKK